MNDRFLINLAVLMNKPTGISTYTLNILPYLRELNPTLLSARKLEGYCHYPIPGGQTPEQGAKGHFKRLLWTQFRLPKLYRELQGSLLFSPLPEAPLFQGCRFVVMVHDLIPLRFPERRSPLTLYSQYYLPQVLNQATHIICNSQATANDIVDYFSIKADRITPILLGYDRDRFQPLNLPVSNYFLYVGRHVNYKNLHRVIEAFAKLPHDREYELWLVGPSDRRYTPSLIAQINELGVTEQVKFLDYVSSEQLPILMNQAIALIFPSLWEGFGLPVLEAMACGTPVITSNCSSLPEITADAAILVDPYQVPEITAAMETLIQEPQAREDLSQASLKRAAQFSWCHTGQATCEVLQAYL
ncbi:MAG: glycosyltransferase family 4 protein [Roseofilum sp. SBFL]|uniref:glycosyltransferase family 4 protein n=1 Tax=unclassified Roseofilum TaxID=2620099 RepID=UPI001B0A1C11|nr:MULTISPECIES: glycosyltransferase family 1 protein [unclassified Roseofilum]MBP0015050.1 glycosyltransferase family 4 protein [Roseofilum sp. SID3]MBP0041139.1 glycosyltransferase family 4 protein [Roseofilum sp. SBFL]